MTRIKCTECSQVLLVNNGEIPNGLRPGELFERKCPSCDEGSYMELAEAK